MGDTLSEMQTWSDDGKQITIRTSLGPAAAIRIASFEADGARCAIKNVQKIPGHEQTKWRDFVYEVKR